MNIDGETNITENSASKSKIKQAELRIQNDLMDIKKNRISTKLFDVQLSDIFKDEFNEFFSTNVLIKEISNQNVYNFIIIFDKDYPYSPPLIKLVSGIDIANTQIEFIDSLGNIKLKFLTKENWTPILSLNSILFAMELMIIDPQDCTHNLNSLELYRREEMFNIATKTNSNFLSVNNLNKTVNKLSLSSPKIVTNNCMFVDKESNINDKMKMVNRKRKFSQYEEINNNTKYNTNINKYINMNNCSNNTPIDYNYDKSVLNYQVKRFKTLSLKGENNDKLQ